MVTVVLRDPSGYRAGSVLPGVALAADRLAGPKVRPLAASALTPRFRTPPTGIGNQEWFWNMVPKLTARPMGKHRGQPDQHFAFMSMGVASGNTRQSKQTLRVPMFIPGTLIPIASLPIPIPSVEDVSHPHMGSVMLRNLATGATIFVEAAGDFTWDESLAFQSAQILVTHIAPNGPEFALLKQTSPELFNALQEMNAFAHGGALTRLVTPDLSLGLYLTNPHAPVELGTNGWIDNRLPGSELSSPAYYGTNYLGSGAVGVLHDKKTGIMYQLFADEAGWDHQAINPTADLDKASGLGKLGVIRRMRDFATAWHWNALFLPDGSRMIFYAIENPEREASGYKRHASFIRPNGTKTEIDVVTDSFMDPKTTGPKETPNKWLHQFSVDGKRYDIETAYVAPNNWLRPHLAGSGISIQEGSTTSTGTLTLADGTVEQLPEFMGWHEHVDSRLAELSGEQRQALQMLKKLAGQG